MRNEEGGSSKGFPGPVLSRGLSVGGRLAPRRGRGRGTCSVRLAGVWSDGGN